VADWQRSRMEKCRSFTGWTPSRHEHGTNALDAN
jgi:hypothetical protein